MLRLNRKKYTGESMSRKISITLIFLAISLFALNAITLDGLVMSGPAGEPVAGAQVQLHSNNIDWIETNTDEAGFFQITDLEAASYMLHITAEEYLPFMQMLPLQEDMTITVQLLPEGAGGELTGHLFGFVNFEDGSAGANLPIVIHTFNPNTQPHHLSYEAVTGEDGSYDFTGILDFAMYNVMVMLPNLPFTSEVFVEGDTEFNIILIEYIPGETHSLSGTVTNAETGDTLAGFNLRLHIMQGMMQEAASDENGFYEFTEVPEGIVILNVMVAETGFMPFTAEIEILEDTVFDIALVPYPVGELVLSGTVTDEENGEPLEGIVVHLFGENIPGNMFLGVSNEAGYYEITGIFPGNYQLMVMGMQGMVLFEAELEILENMVYDLVLPLNNNNDEGSLTGYVYDQETGSALAEVVVFLQRGWLTYETLSSDDGFYSFNEIETGNYHLIAGLEGYAEFNTMILIEEAAVFDIYLTPFATGDFLLSGTVTDAITQEAIAGVHIQLFSQNAAHYMAMTDEAGNYEISGMFAGTYQILAWTMGWNEYEPFEGTLEIIEDTVFDFSLTPFEMPGSGSLSGMVYDSESSEVISGAALHLAAVDCGNPNGGWNHFFAESLEDGSFFFENIEEGDYILMIVAEGYFQSFYDGVETPEEATIITIDEENPAAIAVYLQPMVLFTVSGTVLDFETGEPLAAASVRALRPGTGGNHGGAAQTYTDEFGLYNLVIPQGDYIFVAEFASPATNDLMRQFYDHQLTPASADVVAVEEDITGIDFDLALPQQYENSIAGTITVAGNIPENPVLVAAVFGGGNHWEAACVTDMFGNYLLENLPEGEFYILAYEFDSVPTYYPGVIDYQEAEAVLASGNVTGIDFELILPENSGIYQMDGYVLNAANEPVANANVVILDEDGNVLSFAVSNNQGYYLVNGLPSGSLIGIATKVLYETDQQNINMTTTGTADFTINPESTTPNTEENVTPAQFRLSNYPNPFNPVTTISFNLENSGFTVLEIFNVTGQKVITLLSSELAAGEHQIIWDGTGEKGNTLSSGVYLYRLNTGSSSLTSRMILMK